MAKSRDTYKYVIVKGGRIVHCGITRDLERREGEHRWEHSGGNLRQVGRRTTEEAARTWESDHLRQVGRRTTEEAARTWEKGKRKA